MKSIDYNVDRTVDCIRIDVNNWVQPQTNKIEVYKISGQSYVTGMSTVLSINEDREFFKGYIKENDVVLLTKVASDTARYRTYELQDGKKYCNIPIMQIIGIFNGPLSFSNLNPLFDKVIFEKVNPSVCPFILPNSNVTVGKVLKAGDTRFSKEWEKTPMTVKKGDLILVKDNVTTEFRLDGKTYFATEESMVVGVFKGSPKLSNLNLINKSILMKKYQPKYILNSNILLMPDIDYNYIDEADLDNQNMFEVKAVDKCLTNISLHDILFINKDLTEYVYLEQEKYNIINGTEFIEGKLQERNKTWRTQNY